MIDQKFTGLVAGFFFSLIISMFLSIIMIYVNTGDLQLMPIIVTFFESFIISYVVSMIIPVSKIGANFAKYFGAEENTLKSNLLSNLPTTAILVLILSVTLTALNIGFNENFIVAWASSIPISGIAVYIVFVAITLFIGKLTLACIKK